MTSPRTYTVSRPLVTPVGRTTVPVAGTKSLPELALPDSVRYCTTRGEDAPTAAVKRRVTGTVAAFPSRVPSGAAPIAGVGAYRTGAHATDS